MSSTIRIHSRQEQSFLFEHNQSCALLDVQVQIFTVSGKLVKTLTEVVDTHQGLRDRLTWDGRDEYGDKLGRGVLCISIESNDTRRSERRSIREAGASLIHNNLMNAPSV